MITITCPGLDELIKTLEAKGKELPSTYDKALEGLADEAVVNARAGYKGLEGYIPKDDYKFVDEQVTKEKVGECDYIVRADGDEICFYEFGAGYTTDMGGFASEMPFSVHPGSWSVNDKQQFTRYGRWYSPNGHYYNSIPATRAMYNASQVLLQHLENGEFK